MSAYAVVGPTKRMPRFLRVLERAVDSSVTAGTSASRLGAGRAAGSGAKDQISSSSSPGAQSASTRAFATVASILARLRMMPGSPRRRSLSASVNAATEAISKSAKAARKPGRRRRIVIQDRPD
jgi:hypothetical protein